MAISQEIEVVSFVGVFDPKNSPALDLTATAVRDLETKIGQVAQMGNAATPRGPAQVLVVARDQLDVLIEEERIEVRRKFLNDPIQFQFMADLFWSLFDSMNIGPQQLSWLRFGYNFILSKPTVALSIETLASDLFSDAFTKKLGHPIIGAAAWTWLRLPDSTLWLRLEPYRGDPAANRVSIVGNFLVDNGPLPNKDVVVANLSKYSDELDQLIRRIGL